MEMPGSVRNGVVRFPPGFRFSPTDEELVVHYLKRKVLSIPLPCPIIGYVDICKHDPWNLPGKSKQAKYFFTTREAKYPNGNRHNRATVSGYWKATGIDKQIVTRNNQIVGMKKTLVFYHGKPPYGDRTGWIMHEYRLVSSEIAATQDSEVRMEDWVLCRIFEKKSNNITGFEIAQPCNNKTTPTFIDFMKIDKTDLGASSSSSSSSGSNGITEVSTNGSDHEEAGGSNSFSPSS